MLCSPASATQATPPDVKGSDGIALSPQENTQSKKAAIWAAGLSVARSQTGLKALRGKKCQKVGFLLLWQMLGRRGASRCEIVTSCVTEL